MCCGGETEPRNLFDCLYDQTGKMTLLAFKKALFEIYNISKFLLAFN